MAFDGCSSFKVPDTAAARTWLGRMRQGRQGWAGYPQPMLMALVETGTRGLLGVRFGPLTNSGGECGYATQLLHLLTEDMLLLTDRGFDSTDFLKAVAATKAQLLCRINRGRRPTVLAALPDGTYLTSFDGLPLRIIEATITTTTSTGTTTNTSYRLATTLTDHRRHPATTLLRLYHERWEIESTFYALRHTLFTGRVLRSTTPADIEQELWALLTLYQLLRTAMTEATETQPGTDPDRASFTIALEHARHELTNAYSILPDQPTTPSRIGTATTTHALRPRRDRTSQRTLKCPTPRYAIPKPDDPRPRNSTPITKRTHTIHPRTHTPPPTPRPNRRIPTGDLSHRILTYLTTHPHQPHTTHDIAHHTGITYNKARYKLAGMTNTGYITRTSPGHFSTPQGLTTDTPH